MLHDDLPLSSMKIILITGATGFLGQHLVEQLKAQENGTTLRLLCRGGTRFEGETRIETARGDITRAEDVLRAAQGVSEIYHLAGIVSRNPADQEILYRTHIEGARHICEAAQKCGASKVVMVSSSGTIAVGHEPIAYNEESDYKNEIVAEWPYYLSKIFAEKLALDFARRYPLPIVVVNPSLILGPGDDRLSSTGDVALFLEGQILAIPRGGLNFVDARDAASGLIAAMRHGRPGERYLLGGANWTFRELIENVARLSRRPVPKFEPSLKLSLWSARLFRRLFPLVGKSFRLDDASIKMSALFWYCDSTKARKELNFGTRDPLETLRDTVEDLRARLRT
ncbi:MAG TPA: NAD-dependent epimerase/dehydratase family protein [Terriglobia bacterium]|nr:NAD-dependent epimerase/dehydratase family protein [Terriglobia bacterium]